MDVELLLLGGKGNAQEGRLSTEIQRFPIVDDVGIVLAIVACLDDLPRARSRINKTIGRIVAPERPRRQIDDCDTGPVMVGRGVDHRHPTVHPASGPVSVVYQDLIGADDFGDDGDMTRRDALRPLKDKDRYKDRSNCRGMTALITAVGLVPPPAGIAEECDTGLRTRIKHAIGGDRGLRGYDQTGNEKSAPNEALRQHRTHVISPQIPDGRRAASLVYCHFIHAHRAATGSKTPPHANCYGLEHRVPLRHPWSVGQRSWVARW